MAGYNIIADGKGKEIELSVEKICRDFTKEEMETKITNNAIYDGKTGFAIISAITWLI